MVATVEQTSVLLGSGERLSGALTGQAPFSELRRQPEEGLDDAVWTGSSTRGMVARESMCPGAAGWRSICVGLGLEV